jgi:starvation-inducible DNA-binding protein
MSTTMTRLIETKNNIPANTRERLVELCNERLADALDRASQAKQAHWNVRGPSFIALHELFDQVNDAVRAHADLIAERAAQLGGIVHGTVRDGAAGSTLAEYPHEIVQGREHASALASALGAFGGKAREAIGTAEELGDADLADIFTEVSRSIDKLTWMVEAHVQAEA